MVTIISHIFTDISQEKHVPAVKFPFCMRQIWDFFLYKTLRKFIKIEKSDLAPLKLLRIHMIYFFTIKNGFELDDN